MKETYYVGKISTPAVENLSKTKQALVDNGLVEQTTPNEMLPKAIVEGLVDLKPENIKEGVQIGSVVGTIAPIPVDNGMIYEGKYRVRYFDVDGTILKIEYVENGGKLTPPSNPSYDPDYLIFDEWNYDIENYVVEQPTDVGATYETVNSSTYIFCRLTNRTGLSVTVAVSNAMFVDWGDGMVDTQLSHTYANEGDYVIKLHLNNTIDSNMNTYLLGSSKLDKAVKRIYIRKGVTSLNTYAFYGAKNIQYISLPSTINVLGAYVFYTNEELETLILPSGLTDISNIMPSGKTLRTAVLPESVTILPNSFSQCKVLKNIIIPKNVTSIGESAIRESIVNELFIPKNVTSIGNFAFSGIITSQNYIIDCDTVPVLSQSANNVFSSFPTTSVFWVNDDIIEDLKVATNWSTYASYMKPLSWYPSLTNPNE